MTHTTTPSPLAKVIALAALCVMAWVPSSVRAETITPILSTNEIKITSNFAGTTITLFGIIKRDQRTVSRVAGYDIVVRVLGPSENIIVRQKKRTYGLWLNRDSRDYPAAPSYLAVLSNRDIDEVATKKIITENNLNLEDTTFAKSYIGTRPGDIGFKNALLRNKAAEGLYQQNESAVTFLDDNVFTALIEIPSHTPIGQYLVEIYGLAGSSLISEATTSFKIVKTGFENEVYKLAKEYSFLYGLLSLLVAYSVGWLGWFIFKRS